MIILILTNVCTYTRNVFFQRSKHKRNMSDNCLPLLFQCLEQCACGHDTCIWCQMNTDTRCTAFIIFKTFYKFVTSVFRTGNLLPYQCACQIPFLRESFMRSITAGPPI